jgi:hypothetical protein
VAAGVAAAAALSSHGDTLRDKFVMIVVGDGVHINSLTLSIEGLKQGGNGLVITMTFNSMLFQLRRKSAFRSGVLVHFH